jgi:ATP-dependent exoDNAse (exonuclease V) beta subunit
MTLPPLTIYKASAGSGKTFTLAVEYIKLLIKDPQNYRFILAVTFTNKATEEMKTRILSQLYGIAHSLDDSENYMDRMREAFSTLSDQEIRHRAQTALELMIHHYNYFRVETIDSFFQSVLRNLARELDLTANLQVSLNDYEVEAQAVDNIIENIQQENDPLLGWIMDFVMEKIGEDKNWNVIGQIKEFGKHIFKDFYKSHQHEMQRLMNDPSFFKSFTSRLHALKAEQDRRMAQYAAEYAALAESRGLTSAHYSGRSSAPEYFQKLAVGNYIGANTATIEKAVGDPTKLIRKDDLNTPESQIIISEVGPLLRRTEEARRKAELTVNSVELTLRNINELRLLGRIQEEVRNINTQNNNYPLSNTQKLLEDLIDEHDSPFIYEKIGGQLRYIMIDEFQDTSTVQWNNFKILIDECLAHDDGSLIVGDVKQSIYRWRDGDWQLLHRLTQGHDPQIGVKSLDTNYRSQANIITFNNAYFKLAAEFTKQLALSTMGDSVTPALQQQAEDITVAYADVVQAIPPRKLEHAQGSVTVKLLPKDDYEQHTIDEVKSTLELLLSRGIPPRKVAILVRANRHIQLLADYFQQHPITVDGRELMLNMVSDEAFRLDASLAVNTLINAMKVLMHPDDSLSLAALVKAYRLVNRSAASPSAVDSTLIGQDDLMALLPAALSADRDELRSTPLADLAEKLYSIFNLQALNDQSAYVCAFFDQISSFQKNHIAGIDDFLKEWDSTLCGKSIHSDAIDGIRLLTIHKSKGLEFDHVIIPFCDWGIEKWSDIFWVSTPQEPYSQLPIVPVNLIAKKLRTSIYGEQYNTEHIKTLVDNLNILYVAFTRAERNLFVIGLNKGADYPSTQLGTVLPNLEIGQAEGTFGSDDTFVYRFGELCLSEHEHEETTENVILMKPQGITVKVEAHPTRAEFRQSRGSNDFIATVEQLQERQKRMSYIDTGNLLHTLFAGIRDVNDIDKAVTQLEFQGVLYDKPMSRDDLRRLINTRLGTPEVKAWFDPSWTVYNECTIIYRDDDGLTIRQERPDRVISNGEETLVIDFKTGAEKPEHHDQVNRYMRQLKAMGHRQVRGFLWYITPNRIVNVTPTLL